MRYSITDPEFLRDPQPVLAKMRAEGPFVQVKIPLLGAIWLTTTDAAARHVLKSPRLFVRDSGAAGGAPMQKRFWWLPPFMKPLLQNMLAVDGAEHKRLRGLVETAFAHTTVEDMRPQVEAIANELLDDLPEGQILDIQAQFARPLPLMAICALLGIPQEDRNKIAKWIAPISGPTSGWTMLRALPGLWRIMRHFRQDFDQVRASPRPGLISDLVQTEIAGDKLSKDELLGMVVMLFIAGHETTVHLITNAIHGLLCDQAARRTMQQDPDGLPLLVEEFMRFTSPVMMTKPHYVTQDTTYENVTLRQGDQIAALLIGANHDPARFDQPERFLPTRRPNPHLGFGHGPHVCLGMQLARAEAHVALSTLFRRFPNLEMAQEPLFSQRTGMHGLRQLKVVLKGKAGASTSVQPASPGK